ncbi:hypothetical protein CPB84DRAFT_1797235, partial [Gymnopilus junonius]
MLSSLIFLNFLQTFIDNVCACSSSSQLRSLSIDWSSDDSEDINGKHQAVKDQLIQQFPSLEDLWLCDWTKSAFLWKRKFNRGIAYETGTTSKNVNARAAHEVPSFFGMIGSD